MTCSKETKCYSNVVAIVFGSNHVNSLGLVRSLGQKGIRVFYVTRQDASNFVSRSKYIEKTLFVADSFDLKITLKNLDIKENDLTFLFPGDDFFASSIMNVKDLLDNKYYCPSRSESNKYDKYEMAMMAKSIGFNIPHTKKISINNLINEKEIISKEFSYPLFIRINYTNSYCLNFVVNSSNRLDNILHSKEGFEDIVIQEYIDKDYEVGVQGVAVKDTVKIFGIIRKVRESRQIDAIGSTTYGEFVPVDKICNSLISKVKKLLMNIQYDGIFDMELVYKNNEYYFIELNFRNGSYGYAYTKFGYNLPVEWIDLKLDYHNTCKKSTKFEKKKRTYLMNEFADFHNTKYYSVNKLQWFFQLLASGCLLTFNKKDMRPFFNRFTQYFRNKREDRKCSLKK